MTYRGMQGRRTYHCKYLNCLLDIKDSLRGRPSSYCELHKKVSKGNTERAYYQRNKERIKAYSIEYRKTHKAAKAAYHKIYFAVHKEERKVYNRRYYLANK